MEATAKSDSCINITTIAIYEYSYSQSHTITAKSWASHYANGNALWMMGREKKRHSWLAELTELVDLFNFPKTMVENCDDCCYFLSREEWQTHNEIEFCDAQAMSMGMNYYYYYYDFSFVFWRHAFSHVVCARSTHIFSYCSGNHYNQRPEWYTYIYKIMQKICEKDANYIYIYLYLENHDYCYYYFSILHEFVSRGKADVYILYTNVRIMINILFFLPSIIIILLVELFERTHSHDETNNENPYNSHSNW